MVAPVRLLEAPVNVARQLEMFGYNETKRMLQSVPSTTERRRLERRLETVNDIMTALPESEDLSFLHSGLCQTCLPHSRPRENHRVWRRASGRFTLSITPGTVANSQDLGQDGYVGVPYGSKARLILIHLQSEGLKTRTVNLGPSLSAFMRSLGLQVSGGRNGSITSTKEQVLRIARCSFSLQWSDVEDGGVTTHISDHRIVEGFELWQSGGCRDKWNGTVQLSERFHEQLKEHAVPLDKRAIGELSYSSLGLDLYTLFAYRLPRLKKEPLFLNWRALQSQIGSEESEMYELRLRVQKILPEVLSVYPHANVRETDKGLVLAKSEPPVPSRSIRGFRVVGG